MTVKDTDHLESLRGIRSELDDFTLTLEEIITDLAGPAASWAERNYREDAGIDKRTTYPLPGIRLVELSKMRNQLSDIIQAMDERGVDNDL